jgi:autotransporter-associated beta strand protein
MKSLRSCLRVFTVTIVSVLFGNRVSLATSGTWDGETSTAWALNANWNVNTAAFPVNEDTATFSGTANNRTNINVSGLAAIRYITFSGTGVPVYYIGDWPVNSQTIIARNGSSFKINSDAKNSQNIVAAVQLGPDTTGNSYTFQNDHAFNVLTVYGNLFGPASGGTAGGKSIYVNGVGAVKLLGDISKGGALTLDLYVNSTGTTTLSGTNGFRIFGVQGGPSSVIDIGAGETTLSNLGSENIRCTSGGTITGTGALILSTAGGESYSDNRVDDVNATCAINCRLTGPSGFELYTGAGRAGTFEFNGINDFAGHIIMNAAGTISAARFGNRGSTDSNLGAGSKVRFNSNNDGGPKLKYIGTGETTDRTLEFNSHARIEQAGTGHLVFSTNTVCATANGLSLTLMGSTDGTAEISGVIVNNAGNVAVYKQGTGLWRLSGANLYAGGTFVNGGTLEVSGAAGSIVNSSGITIDSSGTLTIGNTAAANSANRIKDSGAVTMNGGALRFSHTAGAADYSETVGTVALASGPNTVAASQAATGRTSALTLGGLTRTSGTVDFVGTGLGATGRNRIFIVGQADGLIGAWATVNGASLAAYSSTLGVYPAGDAAYTDIAARGDTIADNAASNVRINSEGTSGNNALSDAVTTVASLAQNTAFASTVDTAGKTLRASGIAVPDGKAGVTIGAAAGDGTLTAATSGGSLSLANDGADSLTVNAVIADNGAASSLAKAGAGTVTLTAENTFSGPTAIGGGTLFLANSNALQNSTVTIGGTPPVFSSAVPGHAFTLGGLAGSLDLTLADSAANPLALTVGKNNASTTFSGLLTGAGSLTKMGSGTLTLSQPNTFSGGLTVQSGSLVAAHNGALGVGPVVNNGTIDMPVFSLSPLGYPGLKTKVSGAGTNNITLYNGGNTSYFDGDYSDFTGVWNIGVTGSGAKARFNGRDNAAATLVVRTNSTVMFNSGTYAHNATVVLQGGNTGESSGQLRVENNAIQNGPVILANNISDPANDGLLGSTTGNGYINGVISDENGPHPVTKMGNGTLVLSASNTYAGKTWVKAGTVWAYSLKNAGEPSSLGAPTEATNLPIRLGNGTSTITLSYRGTGDTTAREIEMGGSTGATYLEHSGTGPLKLEGAITTANAGNKQLRLQGSVLSATGEVAGVISDYSSAYSNTLFKTGTGAWVLSGANTFKGNVTVDNGALFIRNSLALGDHPKIARAGNNAGGANPHFHLDGSGGDLTIPSAITFQTSNARVGAIFNEAGNNTIEGMIHLTSGDGDTILNSLADKLTIRGMVYPPTDTGRQLRLWGAGDGEISGVIANGATAALPVIKENGTGTWTLSGANTYSGTTYVNSGTLKIAGPDGRVVGPVSMNNSVLTLENNADSNNTDRLADAQAVTLNGGTLNFAHTGGTMNYSETAGTLTVGTGASTVNASQADSGQTSALTFSALSRTGGGSVNFAGTGLGEDDRNGIFFTSAPTLTGSIIGPWAFYNGAELASYDNTLGVIPAPETAFTDIAARGPSVIPNDAALNARINEEGVEGPITLAGAPVSSVNTLLQNTNVAAEVAMTNQTLQTAGIIIGAGKAALTLGTAEGEGALTPLAAGGALLLANHSANPLTVNAAVSNNATASSLGKAGSGTVRLNGPIAHTGTTTIGEGELTLAGSTTQTVAGVISGGGTLAKEGSGKITLSAANTYSGPTVIRDGVLLAQNSLALGSAASGTTVASGGTLDLGGTLGANALNLSNEVITVSGAGVNGRGAIVNSSNTSQYNAMRYLVLAGDTVFGGEQSGGRWDVRNTSTDPYLYMNGYNITKVGSNMVGLTSVPVTPGAGNITVAEGIFRTEVATALNGSSANTLTVQGGATYEIYGLTTPVLWSLVMNDRATFSAVNGNSTALSIWAGPVTVNGTAFLYGTGAYQATLAGDISGSGTLVKNGNDSTVIHLTGTNNSYSGGTIVSNSTLWAHNPGSLPGYDTAGKVTVLAGKRLKISAGDGTLGWNSAQVATLISNTTFTANNAVLDIDVYAAGLPDLSDIQKSVTLNIRGTNTVTLSGVNTNAAPTATGATQYGELRFYEGASVTLAAGSSNILGRTVLEPGSLGGTLTVNGPTRLENLYVGNGNGHRSRVFFNADATMNALILAQGYVANGAVYQTGCNVDVSSSTGSGDKLSIGHNGSYGYYRLNSGTLRVGQLGLNGSSYGNNNGVLDVLSGSAAVTASNGWLLFGWTQGNGVANLFGGSLAGPPSGNDTTMAHAANYGSFAMINLLGEGALLDATGNGKDRGIDMARSGGNLASIINLNAGTILANLVRAGVSTTPSLFNFGGGTLKANSGSTYATSFMQGLTAATVYPGGAVFDTTNAAITLNQSLVAPTGLGVGWISVANGGAGYIGAPVVLISGGSGFGATAVSIVDLDPDSLTYGQVTGVTVTSPGVGYQSGDALTVELRGGGFTTLAKASVALMTPNTAAGGLTKFGSGKLTLGGTNTYGGATVIAEGTLSLAHPDALPTNAPITVAGGLFELNSRTVTNGAVTVAAGSIANGSIVCDSLTKTGSGVFNLNVSLASAGPVRIDEGTLRLPGIQPGLYEGRVSGSFETTTANPMTATPLGTRYADLPFASNAASGGIWLDNSTYVYSGYIWNNAPTNEVWSFAKEFDDSTLLKIDGNTLINNSNHQLPMVATYELTPGAHPIELRFGQGTGGVGPKVVSNIWTTAAMGFGYDPLARNTTYSPGLNLTHQPLMDPGDGTLLTLTNVAVVATNRLAEGTSIEVASGAAFDLGGNVQSLADLSGSGTVSNGTLTVTGTLSPAGDGALGTLTVAATVTLTGTLSADVSTDGSCDRLAVQGDIDLTGASLVLVNPEELDRSQQYTLITCTGTRTGTFASVTVPDSRWHAVYLADGTVNLVFVDGTLLLFR